jgi:hypothetical protein
MIFGATVYTDVPNRPVLAFIWEVLLLLFFLLPPYQRLLGNYTFRKKLLFLSVTKKKAAAIQRSTPCIHLRLAVNSKSDITKPRSPEEERHNCNIRTKRDDRTDTKPSKRVTMGNRLEGEKNAAVTCGFWMVDARDHSRQKGNGSNLGGHSCFPSLIVKRFAGHIVLDL